VNNDQTWAMIIGAATVAALRIIDFFFPKGRWYNWGGRSSREAAERQDESDAVADAETDEKRRRIDKDSETGRRARDKKRHREEEEEEGGR
jgi:hypothetical protein